MARENPDGSKIISDPHYLGYGLSKKSIKRTFDYIRSWFIRYEIPFKSINPYLTLYLLDNLPSKSVLIKKIKDDKNGKIYKPLGTLTVISNDHKNFPRRIDMEPLDGKDYIVLDYIPNFEYRDIIENGFNELDIEIIDTFCHVKLFEIENGLTPSFFSDMMHGIPKFPDIRLGNIRITRRK